MAALAGSRTGLPPPRGSTRNSPSTRNRNASILPLPAHGRGRNRKGDRAVVSVTGSQVRNPNRAEENVKRPAPDWAMAGSQRATGTTARRGGTRGAKTVLPPPSRRIERPRAGTPTGEQI
ncbi:MAG: hypothetical protein Kow0054_10300 [Deferrisoma sp.]